MIQGNVLKSTPYSLCRIHTGSADSFYISKAKGLGWKPFTSMLLSFWRNVSNVRGHCVLKENVVRFIPKLYQVWSIKENTLKLYESYHWTIFVLLCLSGFWKIKRFFLIEGGIQVFKFFRTPNQAGCWKKLGSSCGWEKKSKYIVLDIISNGNCL